MSNHLSMSSQQAIIGLIQQGWSQHRIARELDVDRKTVRRHVRLGMDVELAPKRERLSRYRRFVLVSGADELRSLVAASAVRQHPSMKTLFPLFALAAFLGGHCSAAEPPFQLGAQVRGGLFGDGELAQK
jgi:hypothetical protein